MLFLIDLGSSNDKSIIWGNDERVEKKLLLIFFIFNEYPNCEANMSDFHLNAMQKQKFNMNCDDPRKISDAQRYAQTQ